MPLPTLTPSDKLCINGVTGAGKSFFTRENIIKPYPRIAVWDPHREYPADIRGTIGDLARQSKAFARSHVKIACHPTDSMDQKLLAEEFRDWILLVKSQVTPGFVIVVEEAGMFEQSGKGQDAIDYLATQSRHWDCPFVCIAQCAVQIPKITRRQASIYISFLQTEDSDLKALATKFGTKRKHLVEQIPNLKVGEYVTWVRADILAGKP